MELNEQVAELREAWLNILLISSISIITHHLSFSFESFLFLRLPSICDKLQFPAQQSNLL